MSIDPKICFVGKLWCFGILVIITAQNCSPKPEIMLYTDSTPSHSMSVVCNIENLQQHSQLEIRLYIFHATTTWQKQFITNFL